MDEDARFINTVPDLEMRKAIAEGIAEANRIVGTCKHCGRVLKPNSRYKILPAIYEGDNDTFSNGMYHYECALKQYQETTKIMLSEIKSLKAQITNIIDLVGTKNDRRNERAGTDPR